MVWQFWIRAKLTVRLKWSQHLIYIKHSNCESSFFWLPELANQWNLWDSSVCICMHKFSFVNWNNTVITVWALTKNYMHTYIMFLWVHIVITTLFQLLGIKNYIHIYNFCYYLHTHTHILHTPYMHSHIDIHAICKYFLFVGYLSVSGVLCVRWKAD